VTTPSTRSTPRTRRTPKFVRTASRTATRTAPRRATRTAALVIASALALAGCSWFPPPRELEQSANSTESAIRSMEGVEDVTVDVWGGGYGGPEEWILRVNATATNSQGLATLPEAIDDAIETRGFSSVNVSLTVPGRIGRAEVVLSDLDAEAVDVARQLQSLPGAKAITVGWGEARVTIFTPKTLAETARSIRALEDFGTSPELTMAVVSWDEAADGSSNRLEISPTGPSESVVDALAQISLDPDVESISATEGTGAYYAGGGITGRPTVRIGLTAGDFPAQLLAATPDPAADAGVRPRTEFRITVAEGSEYIGYIGLPLGSPAPDGLPEQEPSGSPIVPEDPAVSQPVEWIRSEDPAVRAALDARTAAVTAMFDAAGVTAGIAGEYSLNEGPCEESNTGTAISGRTVLPVFQIMDRADDAMADIVSSWLAAGFTYSDRALGLDIYAHTTESTGLAQATIRGTSEGLSISVTSACVY
jgi:hypothetical protein